MGKFLNFGFDRLFDLGLFVIVAVIVGTALYWIFKERNMARRERQWVERRRREIKEKAARESAKPPR